MKTHWIGIIKWNDGTILRTEPFYKYDEGIKVWSSKFSFENKGKFEWIDYERVETPKQKETLEEIFKNTYFGEKISFNSDIGKAFELGYNVAKEQAKQGYSEEEVIEILESLFEHPTKPGYKRRDIVKFIEQFKKK
jgi:hypothetical protein